MEGERIKADPHPVLEIAEGAPVPLPPGRQPWVVTKGAVEVYLTAPGLRRFVAAVSEGGHVFAAEDAELSLVAPGGARLAPCPAGEEDLALSADRWLDQATGSLALAMPCEPLVLVAGDRHDCSPGDVLAAGSGTLWIRRTGPGALRLGGLAGGDPELPIALTGPLWLEAEGMVEAFTSADLLRQGRLIPALAGFTARLADLHTALADQRDRRDAARLALRRTATEGATGSLRHALTLAADVLGVDLAGRELPDRDTAFTALPGLARLAGLRARRIALEGDWWRRDQGLLILRSAETGEVDTLVFRKGLYHRPGGAPVSRRRAEAYESGAYTIHAPLPASVDGFLPLALYVWKGMRSDSLVMGAAGLGIAALGILTPLATGWILTDIVPSGASGLLAAVGVALVMAALITAVLNAARALALARIDGRGGFALSAALSDRILRLPAGFFKDHAAGDLNQRLSSVEEMRRLVTGVILSSGMTLVFSLVYLAVLFTYDLRLAALAVGLVAIYIAAVALSRVLQMRSLREAAELDGRTAALTYETLEGVAKLRSAAAEGRALARWRRLYHAERRAAAAGARISNHFSAFADAYQILTLMSLFAAAAILAREDLPSGLFIAFLAAFGAFQGAFTGFCQSLLSLYAAKPLLDRARPVLAATPELSAGRVDPGPLSGGIEVSNLAFSYGTVPVLEGLSFSIRPGEHLAIVGGSGSGKSTVLRLLLGFETPARGSITYDGQDLAHLDPDRVRAQIGVVLQSSSLFAGSIFENIRGAGEASLETCLKAASRAGLARDLELFPMGLHTPVTEGAQTLSGGQRQRILIARALATSPRILFFDEATSALDNATQAVVARTLETVQATRITIAHRLSTVRHADRIGVLEGGRFVEIGGFDELIGRGGAFTALARRQLTDD